LGKKRIRPPKQRRLPSALPDPEIRALLGCVRNPGHKTCLSVMYACGLRISEAANLEVGAVDSANMLLRVTGKGNKQRLVPLPRPLLNDLRDLWRTHRHPRWLFLNRDGTGPANTPALGFTFRNARAAAGIKQQVPPHVLRHYVSFLTMSGNVAGSAILMVSHRSQHVEVWRATRHSFLATSRSES
jgi:integrase